VCLTLLTWCAGGGGAGGPAADTLPLGLPNSSSRCVPDSYPRVCWALLPGLLGCGSAGGGGAGSAAADTRRPDGGPARSVELSEEEAPLVKHLCLTLLPLCAGLSSLGVPGSPSWVCRALLPGCAGLSSLRCGGLVLCRRRWSWQRCSGYTPLGVPDSPPRGVPQPSAGCACLPRVCLTLLTWYACAGGGGACSAAADTQRPDGGPGGTQRGAERGAGPSSEAPVPDSPPWVCRALLPWVCRARPVQEGGGAGGPAADTRRPDGGRAAPERGAESRRRPLW